MNEIQNSVNARGEVGNSSLYEAPPCPTSPTKTKRRIVGVSAREEANSDEDNKAHDHEICKTAGSGISPRVSNLLYMVAHAPIKNDPRERNDFKMDKQLNNGKCPEKFHTWLGRKDENRGNCA
ncbi:hypothetical protein RUM44_011162 [Polyplax serrata]|uniref:Uncharacterized protein n=1 Tax=Polyplax serrata TaxID=468196 RepID=A0ABR1AP84_POLSC